MSFVSLLQELQIPRDEYILILRSLLTRPTLILKRAQVDIWINAFAKTIPDLWQANTYTQYVLDAYATAKYVSSYITKKDRTMTTTFKKIKEQCFTNNDGKIETIRKLGNTLLNMQQMSSRQAVHIVLSLPLHSSSRKTIFINTSPDDKKTVVLKRPSLLEKELDESDDIISHSVLEKYIARPIELESISLEEYASYYST